MKKFFKILSVSLLTVLCCLMFACMPSNVSKAKEKMQDAGYKVEATTNEEADSSGCVGSFIASKSEGGLLGALKGESLIAFMFDSKEDAEEFYYDWKDLGGLAYGTVKHEGKWVYAGTSAAIEAFEK